MFRIDPSDATPIYAQLDRAIRLAVATGRLGVGDRLPTVRQLAVDLRINANTVAKVYGELERRGFLETRRGVGTFVREVASALPDDDREKQLASLAERFLTQAVALGYSVEETITHLRSRWTSERQIDGR